MVSIMALWDRCEWVGGGTTRKPRSHRLSGQNDQSINGSADRKAYRSHTKIVQGTWHALATLLHDVRVDHRGGHIGVAEQVLNGPDIRPPLQ